MPVDIAQMKRDRAEAKKLRERANELERPYFVQPFCGECGATDVDFYPNSLPWYWPWGYICLECDEKLRKEEG